MRNWKPIDPPRDIDPRVYEILKRLNQFVNQSQAGFAKLDRGETTDGSSSALGVTDHGQLTGLIPTSSEANDDHTQYLLLTGRTGGQSVVADPGTTATSITPTLTLANFNLNSSIGAQRITLLGGGSNNGQIKIETNNLLLVARAGNTGWNWFTGAGFANLTANGSSSFGGVSANTSFVVAVEHAGADVAAHTLTIKATSGQTGRLTLWQDNVSTTLSYIRASDGAFVGPLAPSGTDVHPDNIFKIVGSADATKVVMIEVDGLTTATTRTITAPDYSGTLILSQSTAGQTIGVSAHASGAASDLAIEGRLLLGNQIAGYTTNVMTINHGPTATAFNGFQTSFDLAGISSAFSGSLRAFSNTISGTPTSSSGTLANLTSMFNTITASIPTGTTVTLFTTGDFITNPVLINGTVTSLFGIRVACYGSSSAPVAGGITTMAGLNVSVNQRQSAISGTLRGITFEHLSPGSPVGAVANFVGIDFSAASVIANNTNVVNWTGLRVVNVTNPTGVKIAIETQMPSCFNQLRLDGAVSAVTHWLEIAAGTTTMAPIKLTSATPITTAVAGCIEFQTDDFFATITTGAARKAFVLDNGTRLTSGRVPFATTNGRLTDDADMTFATDTLTVTKIAAHQLTGDLTVADTINVILNTGTGTKIGTATNQKIGFWNAAPIVQPTTAGAAATFVANTSGIADDSATFDGYTLGQVVKALRNAGILA